MECYPLCRTCTGLCKQPVPAKRVVPSSQSRAKKPVTPKAMPGYIVLICGTATTAEEQRIVFSLANRRFPASYTRRTKFWCEKHSHWAKPFAIRESVKEPQSEELPY